MQLKRKAKLPTVIGLTTKHAVCCNALMLYSEIFLVNCAEKVLEPTIFFNLYNIAVLYLPLHGFKRTLAFLVLRFHQIITTYSIDLIRI